jgi:hypothetical protein
MASHAKSELLRKTADEFDELMQQFDETKETLVAALRRAQLREDAIDEHVRAFDEGKRIIAELLPIRDNVEAIKKAIVEPVASVISGSSVTNKRFAWAGLIIGAMSVAVSLSLPYLPFVGAADDRKSVMEKLQRIGAAVEPAAQRRVATTWQLLLYDRFEGPENALYEVPQLPVIADVGPSHGYDSVGAEPKADLVYLPIEVPCAAGCRVALEGMVRLREDVAISKRHVSEGRFIPVAPIELQGAAAGSSTWKVLEQVRASFELGWIGKKNEWQVVKTPYVLLPPGLGIARIRVVLRPYRWKMPILPGNTTVSCRTDFDEIKLFVAPS